MGDLKDLSGVEGVTQPVADVVDGEQNQNEDPGEGQGKAGKAYEQVVHHAPEVAGHGTDQGLQSSGCCSS